FFLQTPLAYLSVLGNEHFKSERLLGYEMGYRALAAPALYIDSSVFWNEYDNLGSYGPFAVRPESNPFQHLVLYTSYVNGAKARTKGFEVAPNWKPGSWLEVGGAYSYLHLRAENKPGYSDNSTVPSYNGSSPHHQASVRYVVSLSKQFEIDQAVRYVSAL